MNAYNTYIESCKKLKSQEKIRNIYESNTDQTQGRFLHIRTGGKAKLNESLNDSEQNLEQPCLTDAIAKDE